ncbi:MAG: CHAT domain-containing protein [Armatimonadetes bacterium]|nr:CHAT domain-containing protein [Armatimonadota bacterium]
MLALGCAERMRSRALSDQMAWRKVDMAVRVPKALQKRFDYLRTQRQQVYALLQQTTGLPTCSTLLTGKDATKEKFLKAASNCDVLHIATHGYADPDVPEFSGLLLSSPQRREDAKETVEETGLDVLTAQEVFLTPLQAKLVTLSACQTGIGKDVEGEGVLGLTRAFLYAGAKEVVCSLWSVSDESTSKLMQQMYAGMQKGMPVEAAMQAAQLTLLKDPKTSHPFYWAAFVDVKGPR